MNRKYLSTSDIKKLIIERHDRFGIGLRGRSEVIVRWLNKKHNVIVDDKFVMQTIRETWPRG